MKTLMLCLVAALLLALPAQAGKPQPQLIFTPDPVRSYVPFSVTGCNYPHSATFTLTYERSWKDFALAYTVYSDAAGCLFWTVSGHDIWFQAGEQFTSQTITISGRKVFVTGTLQTIGQ